MECEGCVAWRKAAEDARAEAVARKVIEPNRDEAQRQIWVLGERLQCHDRHARSKGQQRGPVMRATLRKDANSLAKP